MYNTYSEIYKHIECASIFRLYLHFRCNLLVYMALYNEGCLHAPTCTYTFLPAKE